MSPFDSIPYYPYYFLFYLISTLVETIPVSSASWFSIRASPRQKSRHQQCAGQLGSAQGQSIWKATPMHS